MILSPRFSVSLDLSRDYITLSISSYLPLYRPLSFSLSFYLTFSLFLYTYPFLCLFITDVRLSVSLRLSLTGYVSLSPFLYLSPSLRFSLTLPLSISSPLSFSLSPCPSLRLPLTLPPLSLPSRPLSSSQSRCWFLSALADIYLSIYIYIYIYQDTHPGRCIVQRLRVQAARAITTADRHLSTAIKPASSQFISFDIHFCCELSLYFPIREQEWPQGE